jgi:hypothetical protein
MYPYSVRMKRRERFQKSNPIRNLLGNIGILTTYHRGSLPDVQPPSIAGILGKKLFFEGPWARTRMLGMPRAPIMREYVTGVGRRQGQRYVPNMYGVGRRPGQRYTPNLYGMGADEVETVNTLLNWVGVGIASLSFGVSIYHGYKRNCDSLGWALAWGLAGAFFPIITPAVALAQGLGEPIPECEMEPY